MNRYQQNHLKYCCQSSTIKKHKIYTLLSSQQLYVLCELIPETAYLSLKFPELRKKGFVKLLISKEKIQLT